MGGQAGWQAGRRLWGLQHSIGYTNDGALDFAYHEVSVEYPVFIMFEFLYA